MPSRLKHTTFRIAGEEKRRFLQSFVAGRAELDTLDKLIVSARVKRSAKGALFRRMLSPAVSLAAEAPTPPAAPVEQNSADAAPSVSQPIETTAQIPAPQSLAAQEAQAAGFDPYGVPLVPTFQRGGADALTDRLNSVQTVDHLRRMARAQQIALPAEIRRGEVAPEKVRAAIVRAVEKRIADRRAAAG